jgi:4-hydroxy-3-methylbut-2-enyl diphosphate reductase
MPSDTPLAYVTQTTLSVDDTKAVIASLKARFSNIIGPDTSDICYATQHRQSAVRDMCKMVEVILVVGAKNSSNSNRLCEIGQEEGIPSHLIADASALDPDWLEGKHTVGLTAGASAPEELIQEVITALRRLGPVDVEPMDGVKEDIEFRLPAELRT